MTYVALLRGINVGGNSKIEMPRLKALFENLDFTRVKTFINSGNVIFDTSLNKPAGIVKIIEDGIEKTFGFRVPVTIRNIDEIKKVADSLPDNWVNDQTMKCDIMFLWPEVDSPSVVEQVPYNLEIEDMKYIPGALLWRIDRDMYGKSKVPKIVGTPLHQHVTIRNCNSVRKIYALMIQAQTN